MSGTWPTYVAVPDKSTSVKKQFYSANHGLGTS